MGKISHMNKHESVQNGLHEYDIWLYMYMKTNCKVCRVKQIHKDFHAIE